MTEDRQQEEASSAPAAREAPADSEAYRVKLPVFEGPLDLLLHLIREHKIDVLDIPVAFITDKYIEYLDLMRVLNLDIAGEYLLMAATLAHLKSKMLLPRDELLEEEDEEEGDPRAELVRRLLEYQKYKHAAQSLVSAPLLHRDVFSRPMAPPEEPREAAPLAEVSVFQLLAAFDAVLKRIGGRITHEVSVDHLTVTERIQQLVERLAGAERLSFEDLFTDTHDRYTMVVTFLALLEMARLKMVHLSQPDPRETIWIAATGVSGAHEADAESSFAYRPLEPAAAPPHVPPLTEEEQAIIATLGEQEGDDDDEPLPEY